MRTALNQVDICFVIDTTGSMSSFIQAAKQHLLKMLSTLGAINGLDWQIGLVEYRDHPPQDNSFVKRTYPLTSDLKKMEKAINGLAATGGGDGPEAVYDGVQAACKEMPWRKHSCRFVILVGDAPPHGFELVERKDDGTFTMSKTSGDHWPNGCPCNLTSKSVAATAEETRITLYSICMSSCKYTFGAFTEMAIGTGGQCKQSKNVDDVLKQINTVLDNEFKDILFDGLVLDLVTKNPYISTQEIADKLVSPQLQAVAALARLSRRGFLQDLEKGKLEEIKVKREPSIDHIEPTFLLTSLLNTFFPWIKR